MPPRESCKDHNHLAPVKLALQERKSRPVRTSDVQSIWSVPESHHELHVGPRREEAGELDAMAVTLRKKYGVHAVVSNEALLDNPTTRLEARQQDAGNNISVAARRDFRGFSTKDQTRNKGIS